MRLWWEWQEGIKSSWGHAQYCCGDRQTVAVARCHQVPHPQHPLTPGLLLLQPAALNLARRPAATLSPSSQSQAAAGVCLCRDGVKSGEEPSSTSAAGPEGLLASPSARWLASECWETFKSGGDARLAATRLCKEAQKRLPSKCGNWEASALLDRWGN